MADTASLHWSELKVLPPKREEVLLSSFTEVVTAFDGLVTIAAFGFREDDRRLGIAIGELDHQTMEVWLQLGQSHKYQPETHDSQVRYADHFYEIRVMKIPDIEAADFTARILITHLKPA